MGWRARRPVGSRVVPRAGRGWLLVGDAAGFLDPFTGEGLHRALRSAELAAAAIDRHLAGDAGALAAYDRALARRTRAEGRRQPRSSRRSSRSRRCSTTPPAGSRRGRRSVRRWAS